jgi:hypothetical protein
MIVAVAVTMGLVLLMTQVIGQSNTIWTRSNESLDTFREARAALQMMAQEIGQVRAMALPKVIFPLLAFQAHPDTDPEDTRNQEVYALTSTPNTGRADFCAIGYFCRWNTDISAYTLCRQFTKSDDTFLGMQQVFKGTTPVAPAAAFALLYKRPADGGSAVVDDLASYIWDLHFYLPANLNGLTPPQSTTWPYGPFSLELPPWIEVRCKALGAAAAKHLAQAPVSRDTWFSPTSPAYRTAIRPYEKEFVTRISLVQ